ncbi:conserved phage C-terminal domain-containing protein [Bacillus sp. FJAT-49731]|nr:conserved phage C-terminal domain-containing protein [Lederbergia citrea]
MSKLLIKEYPVMIIPSLAVKLGVNEAVMLQQVHYWLVTSSHVKDGQKWIYNTYKDWQKQLPFWSESTVKRTTKSLEKQGYLISANFNQSKLDQTKWYTIDYVKLSELEGDASYEQTGTQNGRFNDPDCPKQVSQLVPPIPEITTETTTENDNIPFSEVIQYLNEKTNATYRPSTKKTRDLIRARWKEGFTLADFEKVIDLKTDEWLQNPHWNKYLRTETLFGTKFESYLNQKPEKKQLREEDFDLDD